MGSLLLLKSMSCSIQHMLEKAACERGCRVLTDLERLVYSSPYINRVAEWTPLAAR